MSYLCIIPAAAVADPDLTDTQVRVLCAIGTFTNRLGGNVWASVDTLAKSCNLNPRTVQRAVPVLIDRGYLRGVPRVGRTTLYEVVLQPPEKGVTQESLGGDLAVTTPPTTQSPKREKERYTLTEVDKVAMEHIWSVFPKRDAPHIYLPFAEAYKFLRLAGISPNQLCSAAEAYAIAMGKAGTDRKYIKGMHRFFSDGTWENYAIPMVEGRTREEWARSGQDVAEFDRMVSA